MIKDDTLVMPILKWVGGKRQLLPIIKELLPKNIARLKYFEPFVGGGALFFYLQPKKAVINDFNEELINVYNVVKTNPEILIEDLRKHENTADYFYKVRGLDRTEKFKELSLIQRASRVIYLNKTCFNGLYRVNNAGEFNTPFGKHKNPNIVNEDVLRAVSSYLNNSAISIENKDYKDILYNVSGDAFVYLDPPYHPISSSSNFTGYIQGGWSEEDQVELKSTCDNLNKNGVKFLLSNSSTDFIKDLYKDYLVTTVEASRCINSNTAERGRINEVLVRNYEN